MNRCDRRNAIQFALANSSASLRLSRAVQRGGLKRWSCAGIGRVRRRFQPIGALPCATVSFLLLNGTYVSWLGSPKSLFITLLDELWERYLPGFLSVIRQTAEFLRIHTKLAGHLYLCMR